MIQTNQQVYENLITFLSEEEASSVAPKIKYYLDHYVKELSITNFRVYILPASTIDRIIFYTKEDKSEYRQMKFTPDGDLFSVMHFKKEKDSYRCIYALIKTCIDKVNNN